MAVSQVNLRYEVGERMKEENKMNSNIKITTNENSSDNIQMKITDGEQNLDAGQTLDVGQAPDAGQTPDGMMKIMTGTGVLYKPANEPHSAINPNNGAAFEERSNPLSSKGN
ncbi:MAG: hypothetical protein K0R92_2279 [Lachnospiraceae bacterium]|nr:hypothetical protein [Lachnospiraceae bacterium]